MVSNIILPPLGFVKIYKVDELNNIWLPIEDSYLPNLVLYDWGAAAIRLFATGEQRYRISMMYIEFENVSNPSDPVTAPTMTRSDSNTYYNSLSGNPVRDYLRVPILGHQLSSSDQTLYPKKNVVNFFAQTAGTSGVHGKPFSDTNNSKIFGMALVAAVDELDPTKDIIISRFYLPTSQQQLKAPNTQIGVEWRLQFN
jgi:hypothetical protein